MAGGTGRRTLRILGMFVERHELSGKGSAPIQAEVCAKVEIKMDYAVLRAALQAACAYLSPA